jgi:hypothetical protein
MTGHRAPKPRMLYAPVGNPRAKRLRTDEAYHWVPRAVAMPLCGKFTAMSSYAEVVASLLLGPSIATVFLKISFHA